MIILFAKTFVINRLFTPPLFEVRPRAIYRNKPAFSFKGIVGPYVATRTIAPFLLI